VQQCQHRHALTPRRCAPTLPRWCAPPVISKDLPHEPLLISDGYPTWLARRSPSPKKSPCNTPKWPRLAAAPTCPSEAANLQATAYRQMLPSPAPKVTGTQVQCKAQALPTALDSTRDELEKGYQETQVQVHGLMDRVKSLQCHIRELHRENQNLTNTIIGHSAPAHREMPSELEGLDVQHRACNDSNSREGSLVASVSQLASTCRSVAVQCEKAIPAMISFNDVAARMAVELTVTDVDAVRRSSAVPAADVVGVHHVCGTSSEEIDEMRSIGSAGSALGMRRSMWPRVEKDIAVCTMFGALLEELRGRDTEHLYEKEWVDDLMLLGEEVGNVNREIPEQSSAERNWTKARQGMVARFALKELVASANGREMERMYDTDWVGNFPPTKPSQSGHSAWMRLLNKLPRSELKATPVDKLGRHNLSDSIGQLPATTAGDRDAATLPEQPAANSAAAGLEASVIGYGSIVLEAFDKAILTSGGCRGAAPATFAQEIEDDAPPMSHNEGDSPMMFNISTQRQSSFGSCGKGSRSFDLPLVVNIATKRSPRRRRSPQALFDARGAGSVAWRRLREDLGAAGAVSALLYEMPWFEKVA